MADKILNSYRRVDIGELVFGVREAPWGRQRACGADFHGVIKALRAKHPDMDWLSLENDALITLVIDALPDLLSGFYEGFANLMRDSAVYYINGDLQEATLTMDQLDEFQGSVVITLLAEVIEEHRRLFESFFRVGRLWKTIMPERPKTNGGPGSTSRQPSSSDSSVPASLTAT